MATDPRRILVVDDETDIRDLIRFTLEIEGYTVETAQHGLAALEAVWHEPPALVLLDMKMPVMDGSAFAAELRSRHGDRVPIVLMTAAADARISAREMEASGWLGKPFDLDDLIATVARYLPAA